MTGFAKALRIVRNVEPGSGGPRTVATETDNKLSAREFADKIGVRGFGKDVIARHLSAWNRAAA